MSPSIRLIRLSSVRTSCCSTCWVRHCGWMSIIRRVCWRDLSHCNSWLQGSPIVWRKTPVHSLLGSSSVAIFSCFTICMHANFDTWGSMPEKTASCVSCITLVPVAAARTFLSTSWLQIARSMHRNACSRFCEDTSILFLSMAWLPSTRDVATCPR